MTQYSFELLQRLYQEEVDRKDRLNTRISVPIAILTIMLGGTFYYVNNIGSLTESTWSNIFYATFGAHLVFLIVCIIFGGMAYYGHRYDYLPTASHVYSVIKKYQYYYDKNYGKFFAKSGVNKENLIDHDIKETLGQLYVQSTDINRRSNRNKNRYLRYIALALLGALIFGILSIYPYIKAKDPYFIQKVEVVRTK